ncbi:MAG: hypothetical protein Fur0037_12340 [Planctomycetota bacterium]
MFRRDPLAPLLAAILSFAIRAQDRPDPDEACWGCHEGADSSMVMADGAELPIGIGREAFLVSAHGRLACTDCHEGLDPAEHCAADRPSLAEYRRQAARACGRCHGDESDRAPRVGATLHSDAKAGSPLCTDCHAAHAVRRGDPRGAVPACARCHGGIYAQFAASAHGAGVLDRGADAPSCVDCHSGHESLGKGAALSRVRLAQPCMKCHEDREMMDRHGLSTRVVRTYLNDFHGTSVKLQADAGGGGGPPALVCADCHGIHGVARAGPDYAKVMKQNLVHICRRCHEDVSTGFSDAWLSHYEPTLDNAPLVLLVKIGYWILIPFVIGGLSLQILAHLVLAPWLAKKRAARRPRRSGALEPQVLRFGLRPRIEHALVMVLFAALLLTGLPQRFHDSAWAIRLTALFGGIDAARAIHRAAGVAFALLCLEHVLAALREVVVERAEPSMIPRKADFAAAMANLKYYIGLANEPPRFDRFDYRQKFEYWGMLVGSAVMIASGFVLYFPGVFAEFLPGQVIPAAKEAHGYEAMMAMLTIVIWHMYGAHLNPDCFPADLGIFTGRIPLSRMKHEHALEYKRRKRELEDAGAEGAAARVAALPES